MKNIVKLVLPDIDGVDTEVYADPDAKAIYTIEAEHAKIHEGRSFTASYSTTTGSSDDHRTMISFITPAEGVAILHMVVTATADNPAEVFVSEAVTIGSNPGANVLVLNRDRNSDVTSKMGSQESSITLNEYTTLDESQVNGASFTAGTQIAYEVLAAGGGPKAVGGSSRGAQEFELKYATKYAVWIQNIGASINTQVLNIDWYETV